MTELSKNQQAIEKMKAIGDEKKPKHGDRKGNEIYIGGAGWRIYNPKYHEGNMPKTDRLDEDQITHSEAIEIAKRSLTRDGWRSDGNSHRVTRTG
jgi:hypothetical protein